MSSVRSGPRLLGPVVDTPEESRVPLTSHGQTPTPTAPLVLAVAAHGVSEVQDIPTSTSL